MSEKTCIRCRNTFPVTRFSRDKHRPDGLCPYCKPCKAEKAKTCNLDPEKDRARKRKHYLANRERYLEQWKSPEKLAAHREYHKKRQAEDPVYREQAIKRAHKHYATQDPEHRRRVHRAYKKRHWDHLHWKGLDAYLKRTYGLSLEQYQELVKARDGRCDICKCRPKGKFRTREKRLVVDHCHTTQKFRGLLCSDCNTAIGLLKDSIEYMEAAIAYLKTRST